MGRRDSPAWQTREGQAQSSMSDVTLDAGALIALDPELAVLSARAHGRDADVDKAAKIASAAVAAVHDLDDDRKRLYFDLVRAALSDAVKESVSIA